jgi:hypothetical protein
MARSTVWYDNDPKTGQLADQLYHESKQTPGNFTRIAAFGVWTHAVNLSAMKQTNITHPNQKCRFIRHVSPGAISNVTRLAVIVATNITAVAAAGPIATAVPCMIIASGDMKAIKTGLAKTKIVTGNGPAGPAHAARPALAAAIVPLPSAILGPKKTSIFVADIALGNDKRSSSYFVVIEPHDILGVVKRILTRTPTNITEFSCLRRLAPTRFYVWTRWGRF